MFVDVVAFEDEVHRATSFFGNSWVMFYQWCSCRSLTRKSPACCSWGDTFLSVSFIWRINNSAVGSEVLLPIKHPAESVHSRCVYGTLQACSYSASGLIFWHLLLFSILSWSEFPVIESRSYATQEPSGVLKEFFFFFHHQDISSSDTVILLKQC